MLQQQLIPSENTMRRAVRERDHAYDGIFCYGVITTGVFCLPGCAARPARPENLRFFADIEAARRGGLRACKRCQPERYDSLRAAVEQMARHVQNSPDQPIRAEHFAQKHNVSVARLQKTFRQVLGVTPAALRNAMRMQGLKDRLRSGASVTQAIVAAGYGSPSRVYERGAGNIGMTPGAYREGGAGEQISYAHRLTTLGDLLLAATANGVCFAQFGDSHDALVKQLSSEFPKAAITRSPATDSSELDRWINALDVYLTSDAPRPDLPLDLRGTAFQIRVWRFLLELSDGDLVSYAEVARGIDAPRAVRAAASACGANRIIGLVPCHRVLRGDGAMGGYRWGVERKRVLIDNERQRTRQSGRRSEAAFEMPFESTKAADK